MNFTKKDLRNLAISHTLFPPTSLLSVVNTLGFIQADPISSPAHAQDLILRLRVKEYKVGDLEKHYSQLEIEEDYLYAYGFITQELQRYIHPRKVESLSYLEKEILKKAEELPQPLNSRELEILFGKKKTMNAWGGQSLAIKVALDNLHHAGLLRISHREKGRRIYSKSTYFEQKMTTEERLQKLILAIVHILYPITERTLHESLFHTRKYIGDTKPVIDHLVKSGLLERHSIDHLSYVWIAGAMDRPSSSQTAEVKILAPFDPLVWDRRRFEHLWGWPYRFEAYTPQHKRVRGYYAMPILWKDEILGWSNISVKKGNMTVENGYRDSIPQDPRYKTELEIELKHIKNFLDL